jgi:hypothetical protein
MSEEIVPKVTSEGTVELVVELGKFAQFIKDLGHHRRTRAACPRLIIEVIDDLPTTLGSSSTSSGCEMSADGCEISADGCEISADGCEMSADWV